MRRRVAVVGTGPTWRRGVAAVLADAGFVTVEVEALSAWKPGRGGAVALRAGDHGALAPISSFATEYPHIPVVAVMPDVGAAEYAAAMRSGARGVLGDDDAAEAYALAFNAAFLGWVAVPVSLMRAIAARVPASLGTVWLAEPDIERLRNLAEGITVSELAERAGYSEREMFRMLNDLYDAVGVANRTQAIIWATRHGVLDDTIEMTSD